MPAKTALRAITGTRKCDRCIVHHRALCRAADAEAVDRLNRYSHLKHYRTGDVVMHEGDDARLVGNVVSGALRVTRTLVDGRHQVVGLLFPSDFFGRAFADTSSFSVEAATDTTLCILERKAFENVLAAYPALEHELLVRTLDDLDDVRERLVLVGCQTTLEKVATFFVMLLDRQRHECAMALVPWADRVVTFPVGRQDIASYLSTTVESLSRQIHQLADRRVLRIVDNRRFEILDPARLLVLAGRSGQHPG